jgi:hypothetical protein
VDQLGRDLDRRTAQEAMVDTDSLGDIAPYPDLERTDAPVGFDDEPRDLADDSTVARDDCPAVK